MLLSLSSIFQDFFDSPEDDPLLQDDSTSDDSSGRASSGSTDDRSSATSDRDAPSGASAGDKPAVGGDGVSSDTTPPPASADTSDLEVSLSEELLSNVLRHGIANDRTEASADASEESRSDDSAPQRTKKFVVPYDATAEDLEEVNEAISSGWSFRRIAVTKARASVKPEGKKVIITLEQTKPRSLFDF
jgi:hypothetical protein